jgi:hypothetical protein
MANIAAKFPNWKDQDFPEWYSATVKEETPGFFKRIFWKNRTKYEDYFISQLRSIYMDLDGDLRTLRPEYSGSSDDIEEKYVGEIGEYIDHLLSVARKLLGNEKLTKRQMLIASSILNEVEECLIWITPTPLALAQMPSILSKMEKLDSSDKYKFLSMLKECEKLLFNVCKVEKRKPSVSETESYRAALEECINFIHEEKLKELINTGLQIERLRSLRYWGFILLILLIIIFPMVGQVGVWPIYKNMTNMTAQLNAIPINGLFWEPLVHTFGAWLTALSFCIVGGIGGFLSGLLQVRDSKTDLGMYEVSVLLLQIRPIFGGFAALISFMLLSWGIMHDFINTSNPGSYAMVAFVSGFSERYFIKLLKLKDEEKFPEVTLTGAPVEEMKSDDKAKEEMKSDDKAKEEMKSDDKAKEEMKSDDKATELKPENTS